MSDQADPIPDIWGDDLFGRRQEADLLIGYIESVCARPNFREDARAHTIAVDAAYGEGKSFFLRRLAKQLGEAHPVAFVDAWADDLADEPLTALVATLEKALDPLIANSPAIDAKWQEVVRRTGKIAKIVSVALAKRGISLALGAAAVEAVESVALGRGEGAAEAVKEGLQEAAEASPEGTIAAVASTAPNRLMRDRIASFEEGQAAIGELKRSLSALVSALEGETLKPPIIIAIDELDRCRPPYALKLLEEVKHLFDVPGLVFIFGMHTGQLAQSVSGAYGPGFDGHAYLRRFLNRKYRLQTPGLEPLLEKLMSAGHGFRTLAYPTLVDSRGPNPNSNAAVIARYMDAYGFTARDAFEVVDILQTAIALAPGGRLAVPYLLPLIFGHLKGLPPGELAKPVKAIGWHLLIGPSHQSREEIGPHEHALQYKAACAMSDSDLQVALEDANTVNRAIQVVSQNRGFYEIEQPLSALENYPRLIQTVSRFTNPQLEAAR